MDWIYIIVGLAVIGGAAWATLQKARDDGAADVREAVEKARAEAIHDKKEKDDEVANLAPADLDKRFDKWVR